MVKFFVEKKLSIPAYYCQIKTTAIQAVIKPASNSPIIVLTPIGAKSCCLRITYISVIAYEVQS